MKIKSVGKIKLAEVAGCVVGPDGIVDVPDDVAAELLAERPGDFAAVEPTKKDKN